MLVAEPALEFESNGRRTTSALGAHTTGTPLPLSDILPDITDSDFDFLSVLNHQSGGSAMFGSNVAVPLSSGCPYTTDEEASMTIDTSLLLSIRTQSVEAQAKLLSQRQTNTAETSFTAKVLLGQIRQYPRMMMQGKKLPPFIHPRCGSMPSSSSLATDWSGPQGSTSCVAEDKHVCMPETLAVCANLIHLFYNRTPASSRFAWETIYEHQKRLHSEHLQYSSDEVLEALQATVIYLLLQAEDVDSVDINDTLALCDTIHAIAKRYRHLSNYQSAQSNPYSLDRRTWTEIEGARRTICLLWIIELVLNVMIGPPRDFGACAGYATVPLPCGDRLLWNPALPDAEWTRRYRQSLGRKKTPASSLLTIADLRFGRHEEEPAGIDGQQEELRQWCEAGLDEFAALVWMAGMLERS